MYKGTWYVYGGIVANAINLAGQAVGGVAKTGGSILSLFLLRWRVFITVLFLIIYLSSAIGESINEKSLKPLVFKVGGRILSADETQYWRIKEIEANGWQIPSSHATDNSVANGFYSFFAKFGFIFDTIANVWFIFILGRVLFLIFNKFNSSLETFSIILAILMIIMIQALYGTALLYLDYDGGLTEDAKYKEIGIAMTPLKGVGLTFYHTFVTGNLKDAYASSIVPNNSTSIF